MKMINELKSDDKYKSYRNVYKLVKSRLDLDQDVKEIMSLHNSRLSRRLYGANSNRPESIFEASAQDLANRSRITEIRQRTAVQISLLQAAIERLHKHVRSNYGTYLRGASNEATRSAILYGITAKGESLIHEANAMMDSADMIIRDIDQASHSMRRMVDTLSMLNDKSKML